MSRYYQTDKGSYLQNIAYQSPLELLDKALATQQQGYDNAVNSTALFNNLDIKYLDSEEERANVNNIKKYYEGKANEIVNALQANPNDWRKHQSSIRNLSRELQQDMQTGNISKIQGSYAQKQAYDTRMEELRKKDPIRYQVAVAQANKTWGGNSLTNGLWNQEDIIATPDWNKMLKENLANLKANIQSRSVEAPDGIGYIIDNSYRVESLTEDKLMGYLAHQIMGDANIQAWAAQSQRFGLGKYYDDEGKMIPLFREEEVLDENGKLVGKKMSANPNSGFYHQLSQAQLQAYTQDERSTKTKNDNAVLQQMSQAHAVRMAHLNSSLARKGEEDKFFMALKTKAIIDGDPHAQQMLDQYTLKGIVGTVGTVKKDLGNIITDSKAGIKSEQYIYDKAKEYALSKSNYSDIVGTKGVSSIQQYMDYGKMELKDAIEVAAKAAYDQEISNKKRNPSRFDSTLNISNKIAGKSEEEIKAKRITQIADNLKKEWKTYEKHMEYYVDEIYNTQQTQQSFINLLPEGANAIKSQILNYPNNLKMGSLDGSNVEDVKLKDLGEFRVLSIDSSPNTGRNGILVESNEKGRVVIFPSHQRGIENDQLNNNITNIAYKYATDENAKQLIGNSRVRNIIQRTNIPDNEFGGISSYNDYFTDSQGNTQRYRVIKNQAGFMLETKLYNEPLIFENAYQLNRALEILENK